MKLLEFEIISSKNEHEIGGIEYAIQLEDKYEQENYEWTHEKSDNEGQAGYFNGYWDCYMTEKLGEGMVEERVLYYFMPNDLVPQVGKTWQLDDMKLLRTE